MFVKNARRDQVVGGEREERREGMRQAPNDGLHVQFLTLDVVTLACDGAETDKRREGWSVRQRRSERQTDRKRGR